jgi:hypothetical protein
VVTSLFRQVTIVERDELPEFTAVRMQHRYLDLLAAATTDVTVLDAVTNVLFLLA